jgi:hypothetical protein
MECCGLYLTIIKTPGLSISLQKMFAVMFMQVHLITLNILVILEQTLE